MFGLMSQTKLSTLGVIDDDDDIEVPDHMDSKVSPPS